MPTPNDKAMAKKLGMPISEYMTYVEKDKQGTPSKSTKAMLKADREAKIRAADKALGIVRRDNKVR